MLSNTCVVREDMVRELAGARLEKVGRGVSRTAFFEKSLGGLPRILIGVLGVYGGWILRRNVRRFTDDAIWLQGMAQTIATRGGDLDLDLDLFASRVEPQLDALKVSLRSVREPILEFRRIAKSNPKVVDDCTVMLAALSDLFEAVEGLRWTVLEEQASRAKHLEGYVATNADELDAIFAKMEQHS